MDDADWAEVAAELADLGCALLPRLLTVSDARALIKLYDRDDAFRSTVTMSRHRFGEDEYRYLAAPLPEAVDQLRRALYPQLLPIARDWYDKTRPAHTVARHPRRVARRVLPGRADQDRPRSY